MELSLSKLPWWGQIGAFVVVCAGATYGFWHFYVADMSADVKLRQTRLTSLRSDISRACRDRAAAAGIRIAGGPARAASREPQAGVAGGKGRRRHPAPSPGAGDAVELVDSAIHAADPRPAGVLRRDSVPSDRPRARTTISGCSSIASASSRESSASATSRFARRTPPEPNATIMAECVATTFVLQEAAAGATKKGAKVVPKQPAARK